MVADLFCGGEPQDVRAVLRERDARAAMQRWLLAERRLGCLVVVTMNIPGPIKSTPALDQVFAAGAARLAFRLPEARLAACRRRAGGPALFALSAADAVAVKRIAIEFEDRDPWGRLFDVDVLDGIDGAARSRSALGLPARRCLVCDRAAKECARSRRHDIAVLLAAVQRIVDDARGRR